jgi:hypothetical protein
MSQLRVNNISNVAGTKSATSDNVTDVGNRNDVAYAQFNKISAQAFTSGHQNILLDETFVNKNITLSSNQITFALSGVYQITAGMRFANDAGDVWTGVNLWSSTTGIVGNSYGTGNVSGEPGPGSWTFLANITNISVQYFIRLYRAGSVMSQQTPDTNAGRAIAVTIVKVS